MFKKKQQTLDPFINRQSSVKIPPIKNTSSNNTLHINAPLAGLYFNIEKGRSADEEEVLLAVHKT